MQRRRISILRPSLITVLAFLLTLAFERFTLPSTSFTSSSFTFSAGDTPIKAVYSELKGSQSTIWVADPADPAGRRRALLTINHQTGYGVVGSMSTDGDRMAYAFLPEGRRDAFSEGQLWVSTVVDPAPRLISNKVDLHRAPIWSPAADAIVFKTVEDLPDDKLRSSLVVAPIDNPAARKTVVTMDSLSLFPIGWSPDGGSIYYYSIDQTGTEGGVIDLTTLQGQSVGKLADGPVWDVRLAPDRRRFLFQTVRHGPSGAHQGAIWIFDREHRQASGVSSPRPGPIGAIWHPSGDKVTRNESGTSPRSGQALLNTSVADGASQALKQDADGVASIPMSWSPDSVFLAVRRRSTALDGRLDNLAILDARTGKAKEIKGGYAEFVGWTTLAR